MNNKPEERVLRFWPGTTTVYEWRSHQDNVIYLRELMQQPRFLQLLSALYNSAPQHVGAPVSQEQALMQLGKIAGYNECLNTLALCAHPLPTMDIDEEINYKGE